MLGNRNGWLTIALMGVTVCVCTDHVSAFPVSTSLNGIGSEPVLLDLFKDSRHFGTASTLAGFCQHNLPNLPVCFFRTDVLEPTLGPFPLVSFVSHRHDNSPPSGTTRHAMGRELHRV